MPIHATTQPLLLEPPRPITPRISSKRREKRLLLALHHLNKAREVAPFLAPHLDRAARQCVQTAERTAAKDEAEIVEALRQGWGSVDEIAVNTPSQISREQVNKILNELASLTRPVVRRGRERDPNFEVGRGGNRYVVVWSLLIDETETP